MRVVAENPAPIARIEWTKIATTDGFIWRRIAIGPSEKIEIDFRDGDDVAGSANISAGNSAESIVVGINGVPVDLDIVSQESTFPCTEIHFRGRVGSFVADLWATVCPSTIVQFRLLITYSDPTNSDLYANASVSIVGLNGVHPFMWWGNWRGIQGGLLLENQTFADTQGQAFAGFFAMQADEAGHPWLYGPIMAMVIPDEWDGKWGPFRTLPFFPSYSEGNYIANITGWWQKMASSGHPWLPADLGLSPNPSATGAQQDFGASKMGDTFMRPGGGPLHALHAMQMAMMEACRPGDFREASGAPVKPWEHPNWVTWSGYTHYHPSVSSDRLGKGPGQSMHWSGGWGSKDREHWSSLNLCGAYLMTGDPLLLHLIECEARQFLSGETIDPRLSTSNVGAPRGIGRTLLTASWIDCCLREGELRELFRARVADRVGIVELQTRTRPEALLSPLGTIEDPRVIRGIECIQPWQEAQGIIGIRAAQLRFGNIPGNQVVHDKLAEVLVRVCTTWVNHGWWEDLLGWHMADAHAWNNGQPLPPEAYPGPLVVRREGFEEWSWGAVVIAHEVLGTARTAALVASIPLPAKVADGEWLATR